MNKLICEANAQGFAQQIQSNMRYNKADLRSKSALMNKVLRSKTVHIMQQKWAPAPSRGAHEAP